MGLVKHLELLEVLHALDADLILLNTLLLDEVSHRQSLLPIYLLDEVVAHVAVL